MITSSSKGQQPLSTSGAAVTSTNASPSSDNPSTSSASKKTLDLEPNPFEQSFARSKVKPTSSSTTSTLTASVPPRLQDVQSRTPSTISAETYQSQQRPKPLQPQPLEPLARSTHIQPQQVAIPASQQLSPPVLTPGGTRRLHPNGMLPPLAGMVSPGGGSLPGTPSLWSAFFGGGVPGTPGSATSQYFNMAAVTTPGVDSQQNNSTANSQSQPRSQQSLQSQAQYFNLPLGTKKTGFTPGEGSMRTGLTPGGPLVPSHLQPGNFSMMLSSLPPGPTTPGGPLSSFTLQGGATGKMASALQQQQAHQLTNLKMPDSIGQIVHHDRAGSNRTLTSVKEEESSTATSSLTSSPGKRHSRKSSTDSTMSKKRRLDDKSALPINPMLLKQQQQLQQQQQSQLKHVKAGRRRKSRTDMSEEEKRQNFLERNRLAASKCRQRKKQMVEKMKHDLQFYSSQYGTLTSQVNLLREHVLTLRTILYAHKNCAKLVEQVGGAETLNTLLNGTNYVAQLPQSHEIPSDGSDGSSVNSTIPTINLPDGSSSPSQSAVAAAVALSTNTLINQHKRSQSQQQREAAQQSQAYTTSR